MPAIRSGARSLATPLAKTRVRLRQAARPAAFGPAVFRVVFPGVALLAGGILQSVSRLDLETARPAVERRSKYLAGLIYLLFLQF